MVRRSPAGRPAADVPTVVANGIGHAVVTAVTGLAIALILSMGSWALASHAASSGANASLRTAVLAWLYVHHVTIGLPAGQLSLVPLGLLAIPTGLCYAAGRHLDRRLRPNDLGALARVSALFALSYGVCVALAAGLSGGAGLQPHALEAWVSGTLVALLGGSLGLLRASGLDAELLDLVPFGVRQSLAAAVAALMTLVGVGAALLALLLAASFPEALQMTQALDAGLLGGVLLALLGVCLLPNLVVWLLAFTTGVGFSLGDGGAVTPRGVSYGPLPVLPPLAAAPPEGALPGWSLVVLVVPLVAGVVAGLVVHRRLPARRPEQAAASAALAGVLAGAALGLLSVLSAGSAGAQRMTALGPVGWQVGLAAAAELSLVAAVVAWEAHRRAWDGRVRLPDQVRERLGRRSA